MTQVSGTKELMTQVQDGENGHAQTILVLAGTGSNWLPEWLPGPVR